MATSNTSIYKTRAPTASAATTCCETTCCLPPACEGLQCPDRTRWFAGQLITQADLNNEQSYLLAKNRLHNRYLHGWGVVCGMQVVCSECDGWVTVKTGYAIDPCGNDIIVCADQPFNVAKAIQICCTPAQQPANCSPLRYTPSPTCHEAQQQWCITIQYQEQQSQMVTPLKQMSSCCQTQTNGNTPIGACEATRIAEGFQIGLIPAPQASTNQTSPAPGTIGYQISQCLDGLIQVYNLKPSLSGMSNQQAYQATCSYLVSVKNIISTTFVSHCQIESDLNKITIPTPPKDDTGGYIDTLTGRITEMLALIAVAALDCVCIGFTPPCSPDPCDNRLILGCVTVQNGKIINICHFGNRRQVVTFPVLYYWLSLFGFDNLLNLIIGELERMCCGQGQERSSLFGADVFSQETFASTGISNPAAANKIFTYFISQKLGSTMVNAIAPTAQTVDLRPLIGQNEDAVTRALSALNINPQNITKVDSEPSWTDGAIAASAQFAPAAFSVSQPLTVFTKGNVVVGFDVTNPTNVLRSQVADLKRTVDLLRPQTPAPPAQPGGAGAPSENK